MSTNLGEEDILRKKVWKIINLVQVNQLFVHHAKMGIKYLLNIVKKCKDGKIGREWLIQKREEARFLKN